MTDLNTRAAAVLEAAVDLLVTKGWCTNWLETTTGRHCAIGAMLRGGMNMDPAQANFRWRPAGAAPEELDHALKAVVETVLDAEPAGFVRNWELVAEWNNLCLQPDPVINGLLEAAKELRNVAVPA